MEKKISKKKRNEFFDYVKYFNSNFSDKEINDGIDTYLEVVPSKWWEGGGTGDREDVFVIMTMNRRNNKIIWSWEKIVEINKKNKL
jgi:hypothetical protein